MNKTSVLLAAVMTAGFTAKADWIDFSSDTGGSKPNGWMSNQSSNVAFYDTGGSDLVLSNFTPQTDGLGLGDVSDTSSAIRMLFSGTYTYLQFDFGNDDPGWLQSNDWAVLDLFLDSNWVGQTMVQVNANDMLDQTIDWSGGPFNEAIFQYQDQSFQPLGLAELIDNVYFDGLVEEHPVPEVQHYATMLGAALVGANMLRRRRKA